MEVELDAPEARVLGALIEKDLATPEYYPLTRNALVAACNQKNNREPVVAYDEETVESAIDGLRQKHLLAVITGAGLRVPKYRHLIGELYNLGRRELALLCVLMLRGPQTLGELRDRTERMHSFADLEEVEGVLGRLIERTPEPMVTRLPRQPGTKEPRFAHLLGGSAPIEAVADPTPLAPRADRVAALEAEVTRLRSELEELQRDFREFRRMLE
ncbi:MAG TPA: YceH family protein [Bryobacteraceae bacterium]|nr:YceH family protein [Bryobacteraceae bacterium]